MKRYDTAELQAAYDFACEYVCDETTAAMICDSVGGYGSPYSLISADEWYQDTDLQDDYYCVIGCDNTLSHYVIALI